MANAHNPASLGNKTLNITANQCCVIFQISTWWTGFVIRDKTWDVDLVLVSLES